MEIAWVCAKSLLIREYCDSDFPILKCGNKIVVISSIDLKGEQTKSWRVHERKPVAKEGVGNDEDTTAGVA